MTEGEYIKSDDVYFDCKKFRFRTFRERIGYDKVKMSIPCYFWNDSITTICEEIVSQEEFVQMIPVSSP